MLKIKYKIIQWDNENEVLLLQVIEQDEMGDKFNGEEYYFVASNGFILSSVTVPDLNGTNGLRVRGNNKLADKRILAGDKYYLGDIRIFLSKLSKAVAEKNSSAEINQLEGILQ